VNNELANSREVLLGHCQANHLQFNSQRYAQYSTMMLLNNLNRKSCLCVADCKRGRKEDGTKMVGCDVCDSWCAPRRRAPRAGAPRGPSAAAPPAPSCALRRRRRTPPHACPHRAYALALRAPPPCARARA
jgi:hypothetical protein